MINLEDFNKIELRVGTIIEAKINKKARKPAYALKIDFGINFGIKWSSAQITELYTPENLLGMQVICCTNLTALHVGSVKSEVRILGIDSPKGVVLLKPQETVENGQIVY